jgi:hypothetical protein
MAGSVRTGTELRIRGDETTFAWYACAIAMQWACLLERWFRP